MGVKELKEIAAGLGITGYSKLRKAELEAAIAAAKQGGSKQGGSKQIGTLNGQPVIVAREQINGKPPINYFADLEGFDNISSAGARRRVRKMLSAAGYTRLALAVIRVKPITAAA